ncbi:MAG TPA: glycosyltransferase [Mycobacteriales bacterium]|nr:glycosyltransferase [Mycobacteriales bacterium]
MGEPRGETVDPTVARRALAQRLRAAGAVLCERPLPEPDPDPARDAAVVLDLLVRDLHTDLTPARVWLFYVALASCLPTTEDLLAVLRGFELSAPSEVGAWLLNTCLSAARSGAPTRPLRVVTGGVVVDVDHSSRHELHTGIQQVVRHTVPLWDRDHDVALVAWAPGCVAHRELGEIERERVLRWPDRRAYGRVPQARETAELPLVVPWRGTLILAEVPPEAASARLAALAQYSGNRVTAIGYDCIPVVSADLVPVAEPNRFCRYLSVIKHSHRVAGISVSATTEFSGFAAALPAQGLAGPAVSECPLPAEGMVAATAAPPAPLAPERELPTVLSVGSFEPRKNHLALLFAAEYLWRSGLAFRLRLIGGSGWGRELPDKVRRLQAQGYPLDVEARVDGARLAEAYRDARFTVFPSLHEGYGLPVAESLAFGTPVITSDYGSTREIGERGGTVLIDPRDDVALVDAMRTLLTRDDRLAALRAEIADRPSRSWEAYADEVWTCLVGAGAGTDGVESR